MFDIGARLTGYSFRLTLEADSMSEAVQWLAACAAMQPLPPLPTFRPMARGKTPLRNNERQLKLAIGASIDELDVDVRAASPPQAPATRGSSSRATPARGEAPLLLRLHLALIDCTLQIRSHHLRICARIGSLVGQTCGECADPKSLPESSFDAILPVLDCAVADGAPTALEDELQLGREAANYSMTANLEIFSAESVDFALGATLSSSNPAQEPPTARACET